MQFLKLNLNKNSRPSSSIVEVRVFNAKNGYAFSTGYGFTAFEFFDAFADFATGLAKFVGFRFADFAEDIYLVGRLYRKNFIVLYNYISPQWELNP